MSEPMPTIEVGDSLVIDYGRPDAPWVQSPVRVVDQEAACFWTEFFGDDPPIAVIHKSNGTVWRREKPQP